MKTKLLLITSTLVAASPMTAADSTPKSPPAYPIYLAPPADTKPKLRLDEVPRAAQATIRRTAGDRVIAAITQDTVNDRKAYVVQFRESGRNPSVIVAEDGSVLQPIEKPPALGLGTTFSDTPVAVQQTLRREIRGGEIMKISKETPRGASESYRVEIKDVRGTYQLRVAPDGQVLENTRPTERPAKRG